MVQRSRPAFALVAPIGLLLACLAGWPSAAAAVTVKDVRLWAGPDGTRVVFDLSGPADHTLFTLENPDRVVVDIAAARLENGEHVLPPGQGFVKRLRSGERRNGDLRLVLDLSSAATPRAFSVPPEGAAGHRLVIDLTAGSSGLAAAKPVTPVKSVPLGSERDIIVAVDAGHGGADPGALGRGGTREKDVALAIARRLKARIDKEPGMRAVLTRDGDYFLAHRERIRRARDRQADMFISVHADAVRDRSVAGSSVYVLSARGASDEAARWLAERENAADLLGGVKLEDKDDVLASVLLDLSQGASMSASVEAADKVLHELYKVGNIKRKRVQSAGFLVLKSPDIPSLLVETAFISNPSEEAKLKNPKHQQRLAEAIHAGVRAYFYANAPPGTLIARLREQRDASRIAAAVSGDAALGASP